MTALGLQPKRPTSNLCYNIFLQIKVNQMIFGLSVEKETTKKKE